MEERGLVSGGVQDLFRWGIFLLNNHKRDGELDFSLVVYWNQCQYHYQYHYMTICTFPSCKGNVDVV